MPSIRQFYFKYIKIIEASDYISKPQFSHLICIYNGLDSETDLIFHFDDEIKHEAEIENILNRVLHGEMFEYAIKEAYFCGKYFYVDSNVLIPRQETEELVSYFSNYFIKLGFGEESVVADVCTGSGCIAISVVEKCSINRMYATDISQEALVVARKNFDKFGLKITDMCGSMLDPIIKNGIKLDCLICNPPYIKDSSTIDERTWKQEPHLALISDPDTYFYEEILSKADLVMNKKHLLAFEIGENMKDSLEDIAKKYLPSDKIDFIKDMDGKWRFMIVYSNFEEIPSKASEILGNHGVIAFPTETVMGLGIAYDDKEAFDRLNIIKGRPENKPYSLMLGSTEDISKYAYVSDNEKRVIDAFLPGPLTILLKKRELPEWVTLGSEYVGIRVPDLKAITDVINCFGKPILAPSANKSGEKPALTSKEVANIFGNEIDMIIEGEALNDTASTIVSLDNGIKIIRQGKIKKEQIEEVLKI